MFPKGFRRIGPYTWLGIGDPTEHLQAPIRRSRLDLDLPRGTCKGNRFIFHRHTGILS